MSPVCKLPIIGMLLTSLLITGCSEKPEENAASQPAPRYVKLATVAPVPAFDEFTFPAMVSAVKTVDLSFEVSGRLVQMDIVPGSDVSKGHLLATIDRQPFVRAVEQQQTRRDQARRELDRIQRMFNQDLVSQSALDSAKTAFELAEIELQNAQQDLSYTELTAPFDAQISERLVENNSVVNAGQPIARLQDVSKVYFNINVPERLLTANIGRGIKRARASLASTRDQWYTVEYVEHRTQPDPVSQTYEVIFAMEPQPGMNVTPGARAVVKVELAGTPYSDALVLPVKALIGSKEAGFTVWVYNDTTNQVTPATVSVVHVQDELAVIHSNLAAGQQVVAAGASQMREDMVVLPYRGE
ncbi:efflux RND transporter periplasmic adaptor subunit [Alteromonas antoniana]|uniref:efflux RND transporter periplasmic adaptor subunit n=1 Tax=Alteromonas antoniana TaxID=2803813 RepID=UPI001C45E373